MKLSTLGCALVLAFVPKTSFAALKAGDKAPSFNVEAARGGKTFEFHLAAALKKGPVVLYFYPRSFTSVCTAEAHDFAENIGAFQAAGASVIGLSGDDIATQREFSSKECRDTFPVGSDRDLDVAKSYDAALTIPGTNMGFANRVSYVIAPDGTILHAYSDPSAANHIKYALAAVRAWREAQRTH